MTLVFLLLCYITLLGLYHIIVFVLHFHLFGQRVFCLKTVQTSFLLNHTGVGVVGGGLFKMHVVFIVRGADRHPTS